MISDKLGFEIKPGDYICYGHALGRCAGLRIGKVLNTFSGAPDPSRWGRPGIEYKITVRGVDDDFNGLQLCKTNGTLCFPMSRIVVLDPERVPQKYRDLLDPIEVKP